MLAKLAKKTLLNKSYWYSVLKEAALKPQLLWTPTWVSSTEAVYSQWTAVRSPRRHSDHKPKACTPLWRSCQSVGLQITPLKMHVQNRRHGKRLCSQNCPSSHCFWLPQLFSAKGRATKISCTTSLLCLANLFPPFFFSFSGSCYSYPLRAT